MTPFVCEDGRTVLGLCERPSSVAQLSPRAWDGVESISVLMRPFPLASREARDGDTVVDVRGIKIGGGGLAMIAGPCSIEGEAVFMEIARSVRKAGANILRGGAFKPRTSPYSFQGLGKDGLRILRAAGERLGMPTVTEVLDPRHVGLVGQYADMFQIGAEHAELRTPQGSRADVQARPPQARDERNRQRPAHVG